MPFFASAKGHHNTFSLGSDGTWFLVEHLVPREGLKNKAPVWHLEWSKYITDRLVTSATSNSDLELAGGLLHLEALAQLFDIQEQQS